VKNFTNISDLSGTQDGDLKSARTRLYSLIGLQNFMYHADITQDETVSQIGGGGALEDMSRCHSEMKNSIYMRLAGKKMQDVVVKMDDTQRDRIKTLRTTLVRQSIYANENEATEKVGQTNVKTHANWKEEAENEFQAFILF